jgi:lysophospholipase L1-like esterase
VLKGILFRALPTLVLLLALEPVLRALDVPRVDTCIIDLENVWEAEPQLGFRLRPGATIGPATVNALGMRGPVLPLAKAPGTFRIVYIGDSSCFGLGVPEDGTFAALATAELAAAFPGTHFEYTIGANPGWSSYQSRVVLERLLPYAPDLVVFYVGARNDHTRARYFADEEIPARMARRESAWHQVRILRGLELATDLAWNRVVRRLRPRAEQTRVPPEAFERNLRAMLEATRRAGAAALVLLPPVAKRFGERRKLVPEYQAILEAVAAEYGVPSTRLQRVFAGRDESALYVPGDDVHPSALGHRLIADEIARVALEAGLVTPKTEGMQ